METGIAKRSRTSDFFVQAPFLCDNCGAISVGSVHSDSQPTSNDRHAFHYFFEVNAPDMWAPDFLEGQDFPDVPRHIADAASEAHKNCSVSCYMSAILMARTVIEATAKNKGITKGTLEAKIDEMVENNFIREHIKAVAHEVRHFGNDMAHGDIDVPVTQDDAVEVLALMDEILNEVYQGPARLAAIQARRAERKKKD
ncbi:DUF4145 domain-containing protein [Arthrobacter sp. G119Y2]|uniref:DUF4145 domain-containing protein n=1 Tax=Arthrobacter sp. G119Y2 TaxID=3134965 RepID=UPI00311A439F